MLEEKNTYRETRIRIIMDFLSEHMQAGRECILSAENKPHQPRILYPVKWSFESKGGTRDFTDRWELSEFICRPAL